jgi:formate hydrogenlyase subunit 3/multisubunit Na+/H+ antiporter MnhD subunit
MGKGTTRTLKEIEQIRSKLGRNLDELDGRFPIGGAGRKVGAVGGVLVSSGLLGSLWTFIVSRFFRRGDGEKKRKKKPAGDEAPQPVVVTVAPRGATAVAVLGIAVWAGVRLYEAYSRTQASGSGFRPSVVKMPESERRSSSS